MDPNTIQIIYPIGTTGLIDVEIYDRSQYAEIPHSSEELAEISYLEACFRESERLTHLKDGSHDEHWGKG